MGFEPTTPTLARLCSTPELRPHQFQHHGMGLGGSPSQETPEEQFSCNNHGTTHEPEGPDRTLRKKKTRFREPCFLLKTGAGDGIRTHDPNLGKVVLYP